MIALVRHGQSASNRSGLLVGRADPPLTDLGRVQAARLGASLASSGAERVLTSPLTRARDTAAAIAAALGVEAEVDERLIELDYGEWDEQPLAVLTPEVVAQWRADAGFRPPGGESLRDVGARVGALMDELADAGRPVVAVSHVSPIKAAVAWALGVGDERAWRMYLELASVTRLGVRAGVPALLSFNETAHLAGD